MTQFKPPFDDQPPLGRRPAPPPGLAADTRELLELASYLGPRDVAALTAIVRRTGEICESEGEPVALAVLDQISEILQGRAPQA